MFVVGHSINDDAVDREGSSKVWKLQWAGGGVGWVKFVGVGSSGLLEQASHLQFLMVLDRCSTLLQLDDKRVSFSGDAGRHLCERLVLAATCSVNDFVFAGTVGRLKPHGENLLLDVKGGSCDCGLL